jgi:hypothetical protein
MPITQTEFETLIADASKRIEGDIRWADDEDHSPAVQFRAEVDSDPGYPLFVNGRHGRRPHGLAAVLPRSTHHTSGLARGPAPGDARGRWSVTLDIEKSLREGLGSLFEITPKGDLIRVRTPFL